MAAMTPAQFELKWNTVEFIKANYGLIDETYLQRFVTDMVAVFGDEPANVAAYAAGTNYKKDDLVRHTLLGTEGFYYALQSGNLPAPTGQYTDLYWRQIAKPVPATQLAQFIDLLTAQSINGDSVAIGRTYTIELLLPAASGHAQYLSVVGIAENWFASEGYLVVNNVRTKIKNIDYLAATWEIDTSYTKPQADALLATKQGAITEQVAVSVYGPANSLLRNNFDKYVRLTTGQDAELNLPSCTLADVGRILALHNYSGPGSAATQTLQATLGTDTSPTYLAKLPRNHVALLEVLNLTRGTPYNDTVAAYAVLSNSPVEPEPKADLVGGTVPTSQLPGFVRALYTVQPADVALPAQPLTLAVANALYFANVQVVGKPQLVYGSNYTSTPGQLTLAASVVATLQPGDLLRYSYQAGGVGATASTFAQLGGNPGDNAALATALAAKADLDANGRILASQAPRRYKMMLEFPAGQTTTSYRRVVFPDMPGLYVIELAQFVQFSNATINGQPAQVNGQGQYTLAYLDTLAVTAVASAGQPGYIIVSQVV